MANTLPETAYCPINIVEDGVISDVDMEKSYAEDVYKLYRAGILNGGDEGQFKPSTSIMRKEVA